MIIVHGSLPIKSEHRDEAIVLARRMAEATRAEDGCLAYDFYVGLHDPDTLVLLQEWENMEALMGHFDTEHMREFVKELPRILAGEVTTRRYAVRQVEDSTDEQEAIPHIVH